MFSQAVGVIVVKDLCITISSHLFVHVMLQGMWCTGCDNCSQQQQKKSVVSMEWVWRLHDVVSICAKNSNEKKAFCCSHSMTWPLFQKTQDPQLTRAISKKPLYSSFSPGLGGPCTLPVQNRPRPRPMPNISLSIHALFFILSPWTHHGVLPDHSQHRLNQSLSLRRTQTNSFKDHKIILMFALECIWSYDLYFQVDVNLGLLQI